METNRKIIKSKIAGISRHQEAAAEIREGDELLLEREPQNEFDKYAVKVLSPGKKELGYLNRMLAFDLAPAIDAGTKVRCIAAQITGLDKNLRGINIEIELNAGDKMDMPRMLPIVEEDGKEWFFDERLRQLRNVETPHDFKDLNTVELLYYKEKAVHRMPTKKPRFP